MKPKTLLITGSEGYLMSKLVERLLIDPRIGKIYGMDIREKSEKTDPKYVYVRYSVTEPFEHLFASVKIDSIIHAAWWFNPTHDLDAQDKLDLGGTFNVLCFALKKNVRQLVYLGSSTAYAAIPENPSTEPFLREEDWEYNRLKRLGANYRYSRNKATVDMWLQALTRGLDSSRKFFWMRGAIVVGPNTRNIVSYVAESPFTFGKLMFRVYGYDPPMQFISEEDMTEVLFRATLEEWEGVYNVAGRDTISFGEVIRALGRREVALPAWLLYPLVWLLWQARIFKFQPALIDLVRYPWVADISKLERQYRPRHTSREAIERFGERVNR